MKPTQIILEGVTGSTAYGLATENSDVDVKGIYLLPTRTVLSLHFSQDKTTKDHVDPDWVYHEVGKFMRLAASGNPTITELLFLEEYTILTEIGQRLIDYRDMFLSTRSITDAYIGYAKSQAYRLNNRTQQGLDGYDSALKNRFAKHTRHCFRLLLQARQLLETGTLTVRVTPEQREWLFKMGNEADAETIVDTFISEADKLKEIKSVLPDEPNYEMIDELLYSIRMLGTPAWT
jgi:predicted nucleotidyltransferase